MGKDAPQQHNGNKRPVSASPYAENYRVPMDTCQRHLINHRLMVSKLSRRELEDKYINLCDEHFVMKKRSQEQEDQIKRLKIKLIRCSSGEGSKPKPKQDTRSDFNKLHDLETQRRELHGKLENLRKCQRKESQDTQTGFERRSQSARRTKEDTTRSTSSPNDGIGLEYDEDKDLVSSTDEDSCSGKSDAKPQSKPCHGCAALQAEKMSNEAEFVKMKLNIKFLNKEIQSEKEKNTFLARQLEEKISYEIMKRNAAENTEVITLTRQVEDMNKQILRQQEEQKVAMDVELNKQTDLIAYVRKEKDKNAELFEECERLKKNIEKIKENMSEVEIERDFLKRQQENFTKIVDENKLLRYQLEELRQQNEALSREINALKEEEAVTKSAQKDLLEKLKCLQQDNDTLSVLLEGLRTENEILAGEKSVLETNLKSLEASPTRTASPIQSLKCEVETQTETVDHVPTVGKTEAPHPTKTPTEPPPVTETTTKHSRASHAPLSYGGHGNYFPPKQVRISQILPNAALLQRHVVEPKERSTNAALLLSNTYAENLAKHFKTSHFPVVPPVSTKRKESVSSGSSSLDRKRISFHTDESSILEDTSTETEKPDDLDGIHKTYAGYFGQPPEQQHLAVQFHSELDNVPSEHIAIVIQSVMWRGAMLASLLAQKMRQFYVEFRFLDERGPLLETPPSAKLLTGTLEYRFDHRVVFELDDRRHTRRRQTLRGMLQPRGKDTIQFVVVQEHEKCCSEIGFASVRLREEIHGTHGVDYKVIQTPIYDIKAPADEIGTLQIKLEGINFMTLNFWI
ncbi:protein fantom-like [Toxorhynchites rutilus septentrionalis]|uniref:protein fantom-like n=1 Tax=Toxorhynchites rutilus septentrionalis TaxID=329112 RepID=UPI0024787E98|nr:protein fantom-like [Toxorhynchites rutilus septentrionalis]